VVLEYILAGIIVRTFVSPSTKKKITAVKPMQTAMGSPVMIRNTRTAKIAAVIMALYPILPHSEDRKRSTHT
jgi:hypothetical protein